MPIPEDPIQLIQRIVHKDGEAFQLLYDRLSPLVYSIGLRMLRSKSDAEELTQDVFHAAWTNADRYDASRGRPEAWLVTMTRSRAIDRLRNRNKRQSFPLEELAPGQEPAAEERNAPASDARLSLGGALIDLPDAQRKVLELAYFDGFSQTEIAERLGVPLGTVKTRMRDGLAKLRRTFLKKEKASR